MFEIGLLHFSGLAVATGCIVIAIRLMRSHKKKYSRFKKVKVGDKVKFYTYCDDDDCIINGTVTDVKGPIVEIDADTQYMECKECLNGLKKVNKHYKQVIF